MVIDDSVARSARGHLAVGTELRNGVVPFGSSHGLSAVGCSVCAYNMPHAHIEHKHKRRALANFLHSPIMRPNG